MASTVSTSYTSMHAHTQHTQKHVHIQIHTHTHTHTHNNIIIMLSEIRSLKPGVSGLIKMN